MIIPKTQIVDLSYLYEMTDGEASAIKEMIDIFLSQIPEYSEQFNQHFKNQDWHQLGLLAHKAKSSVAVMGISELTDDLKKLEIDAKKGSNTEQYQKIIAKFEEKCALAKAELEKVYKNL